MFILTTDNDVISCSSNNTLFTHILGSQALRPHCQRYHNYWSTHGSFELWFCSYQLFVCSFENSFAHLNYFLLIWTMFCARHLISSYFGSLTIFGSFELFFGSFAIVLLHWIIFLLILTYIFRHNCFIFWCS